RLARPLELLSYFSKPFGLLQFYSIVMENGRYTVLVKIRVSSTERINTRYSNALQEKAQNLDHVFRDVAKCALAFLRLCAFTYTTDIGTQPARGADRFFCTAKRLYPLLTTPVRLVDFHVIQAELRQI